MLLILFVVSCILCIVNHHHINCDKNETLVIEIPKGDFEIEANVLISLSANKMVKQVSNWSISEMISIDEEANAIGLSEIVSSHGDNQRVTTFHRFNGNTSNHLIVKKNYCVDFNNFTDSTGHFGWFDNILLKGIYYFYQMMLKHHDKLVVSTVKAQQIMQDTRGQGIIVSRTITSVGLNLKQTGIHNSTVILNFKGLKSVNLSKLDSINLYLADDDIIFKARLTNIIVQNVSSHEKVIQPTINLDCPYYYHEDKKFPGHFIIQDYRVDFTEISNYPAIGLQVKSEFTISTMEEISLIKRFQGKHSLEVFNDHRLGVKYILDDNANETVNCAVEPISADSTSLTNGPLSFDEIAWMNLPYKYVGQFLRDWESQNVTLDVWKAVEANITMNKSVYAKVITTIYMINKTLHDKMFNITTKYEDTFNGYILAYVQKDLYPMFGSQSKPNFRIRKFKNFTRQINDNDIVSSTLTIGKQFIDHCYDSSKNIANITINLKIAQIDNPNGTVMTHDLFGIKRSLSRIIVNLLDVSLLRIVSMNVFPESEIYFKVAVKIVEAVDLTDLHRKNYRQYDWDTLRNYETINVSDDDDCLRIQAERPNTSYVISCNSPNNNLCTRLSSGQSLPNESLTGSSCLVYNNSHDTLISFVKEAPLINLVKPSFSLRGIKFLADNYHYKIIDACTSGYENIPKQPELIKKQFYDKKKVINSFNISSIINDKVAKPRAVHGHLFLHWFLTVLLVSSLGLMLALYAQKVYKKSRYLEPDFVSLTSFNE